MACRSGPGEWSSTLGVVRSVCWPTGCLYLLSYSGSEECHDGIEDGLIDCIFAFI